MTRPTDRKRWERWMNERTESELRSKLLEKFKTFYDFASVFIDRFPQHKGQIELCVGNLKQMLSNRVEQNRGPEGGDSALVERATVPAAPSRTEPH